jgi:hypothetical protein
VRHVLIAYPLLAIGAGQALHQAWRHWRAPLARVALAALLAWQLATLVFAYPDYLAYFNAFAGDHPERILVDSDLDWGGQDLRRLEQVLARRGVRQLWLGYKGTADLAREPLPPFTPLRPGQPVSGWVAITMLTLQENPDGYGWLLRGGRMSCTRRPCTRTACAGTHHMCTRSAGARYSACPGLTSNAPYQASRLRTVDARYWSGA